MTVPKHFNYEALCRLIDNHNQQDRYLDYYSDRMDFWHSVLMAETSPYWIEVAYQNFMLVAERLDRLFGLLS